MSFVAYNPIGNIPIVMKNKKKFKNHGSYFFKA